jgi:uncharacterized protein (TIGR03437 family)
MNKVLFFLPLVALAAAPTVTQVLNNSSLTPPGLPNSGVAPSSIIVIQGTGLANPGTAVLQDSAGSGIPLTLNGASVSVTVNGVTTHPGLYYAIPTQIAAVLPAATPVGTGTLTVTYNGTPSAPAPILVVASAVGLNYYLTNSAVATDSSYNLLTSTNSAVPGQTIVLWATGLGADPADSDTVYSTTPHAVNTPLQVFFGGTLGTVVYQGSAGYPGVNQINVTIPASAPLGCGIAVGVLTGGNIVSNVAGIPIASGGGTCPDDQSSGGAGTAGPNFVIALIGATEQIAPANIAGGLSGTTDITSGIFSSTPASAYPPSGPPASVGQCSVYPNVPGVALPTTFLDAGAITVAGPTGSPAPVPELNPGFYQGVLPSGGIPATGGTFTFKGAGGRDVGPFTVSVTMSNPIFFWTNQSSATTVTRSQGLQLSWMGGNAGDYVDIQGSSTGGSASGGAGFECFAPIAAGQFTVPSYILLGLPAGTGTVNLSTTHNALFSATGLPYPGSASAGVTIIVNSNYK